MAETHSEDRNRGAAVDDSSQGDAGFVRRAGPRTDQDAVGRVVEDRGRGGLVVFYNDRLATQLANVLNEVERERIVVVDQKYRHG